MRSDLQHLLSIARRGLPFTSSDGQVFVRLPEPSSHGFFILPVRSPAFRGWFLNQCFNQFDTIPSSQAFHAVIDHLEAQAQHSEDNQRLSVWHRVGSRGAGPIPREILLDLATPERSFVVISADQWEVAAGENALFHTSISTVPLPEPVHADPASALAILRSCLNVPDRPSWISCLAWLLCAFRPSGPFPFLILQGPSASGKSFATRILRSLVDPSTATCTPLPQTLSALYTLARQNWVLAFDQISTFALQIPDALCRLSNGLGVSLRETAHPEPDPPLCSYRRPVLFTATPRWSPPPELTNRALIVSLPEIPAAKCRPELELLNTFLQAFPAILGALCSAVSTALRRLPDLPLPSGRLPDAFAWILAASPALVCPGEEPFTEDEVRAAFAAHVPRSVDQAVRALMDRQTEWSGTASELCGLLQPLITTSPRGLSQHLHAAASSLAVVGIEIVFRHSNGVRIIDLSRKNRAANFPGPPSKPSEQPQPHDSEELLAA